MALTAGSIQPAVNCLEFKAVSLAIIVSSACRPHCSPISTSRGQLVPIHCPSLLSIFLCGFKHSALGQSLTGLFQRDGGALSTGNGASIQRCYILCSNCTSLSFSHWTCLPRYTTQLLQYVSSPG